MKYTCEIIIDEDINRVTELFRDYSLMPKWKPGLTEIQHIEGEINQLGSITNLCFQWEDQKMVMKETIESNQLPDLITLVYEVKGAWNRCVNHFYEIPQGTRWVMESEFRFEEKNDIPLKAFEEKTLNGMMLFKSFVESHI